MFTLLAAPSLAAASSAQGFLHYFANDVPMYLQLSVVAVLAIALVSFASAAVEWIGACQLRRRITSLEDDIEYLEEVLAGPWLRFGGLDWQDYTHEALKTAANSDSNVSPLTHAVMGLSSEAGELIDTVKKYEVYGQPLDIENLREEVGDTCWYLALLCDSAQIDLGDALRDNLRKLRRRYPGGEFSTEDSVARRDKNTPLPTDHEGRDE